MAETPGVGPRGLDDPESEAVLVGCPRLGRESTPPSGERMDEREDAPSGVSLLSFPVCPFGAIPSEDKETVTVEVYDTTTLTLTEPSDVMRRRSTLLDVLLVDVNSEELCPQLDGGKAVAESPERSVSEEIGEKLEIVEGPQLSALPEVDASPLPTAAPSELSVFSDDPVTVVDSAIFGEDPGLKFAV